MFHNPSRVVPNLVANEVVSRTEGGARLKQLGAAKLAPGVTFVRAAALFDAMRRYSRQTYFMYLDNDAVVRNMRLPLAEWLLGGVVPALSRSSTALNHFKPYPRCLPSGRILQNRSD